MIISLSSHSHASVLQWLTEPTEPMPLIVNNEASSSYNNDFKISTNGRFVTFISEATNLVENDHNGAEDLFMHDLVTGTTQRVNTNSSGEELETGVRYFSAPTADGQFVAFASSDIALTLDDTEGSAWAFIKNLNTDAVQNISGYGTGEHFVVNWHMHLSDNAQFLTFISPTNVDPFHTATTSQLYRKNLNNGGIELISKNISNTAAANGTSTLVDVSSNGHYILMNSLATDLTTDVIAGSFDLNLFLYDAMSQSITLINNTPNGPTSSYIESAGVSNFGDVAFVSRQSTLVNGDTNNERDVFFYSNGNIQRINLTSDGQQLDDDSRAYYTDINDAGSHIVFSESSSSIDANDTNGLNDVFVYDVNSAVATLVTRNQLGFAANSYSTKPRISGDGNRVLFTTHASDLNTEPVNPGTDELFVHDMQSGLFKKATIPAFTPTTITSNIRDPRMSRDQMTVVYSTESAGFDGPSSGKSDLYLLDRTTDQHQLLFSKAESPDISPSGQYVAFTSDFSQPDGQTELAARTVYLYDRDNESLMLIDEGNDVRVNDDGMVVFATYKNISAQDLDDHDLDVYGFDPTDSSIYLISAGMDGLAVGGSGIDIGGSGANTVVVFASASDNLVPNDTFTQDVFVREWPTGSISKISQTAGGVTGDGMSWYPRLSDNGRFVVYTSEAKNLTGDDYTDAGFDQIIYHDRQIQTNFLASKNDLGFPVEANLSITIPGISNSGRYIAYRYWDNEDTSDFNDDDDQKADVVLFDILTQTARIISENQANSQLPNRSEANAILQISESDHTPPLVGVLFSAENPTDLTGRIDHPGHTDVFLYQQGGPDLILTVSVAGAGSITGTAGINCDSTCQVNFALGSEVNVIATADTGYQFIGWTTEFTACDDSQTLCTTIINRDQTITARFIDPNDVIFSNSFETNN